MKWQKANIINMPREYLGPREPLEIGKTYKISDVLDPDHALLRIPGKKGLWSENPLYCRYNYDNERPTVNEIFKNAEDQWSCNPVNFEEIDPEIEVEVVGFYQ